MHITDFILSKTTRIKPEPEMTNPAFEMFNTGGVEIEVAELLYSLVRVWKPEFVLETGTHLGISALYMAMGLIRNQKGVLETYEILPELLRQAQALWHDLGVSDKIRSVLKPSLQAGDGPAIDLLFLDSEPQYRFDEFVKFWPRVSPGGIIAIHDLHSSLGHHGNTYHGVLDWPYGEWRPKLGSYVKEFQVQMIHIPGPRGMLILQKTKDSDENIKLLKEETR